MPKIPTFQAEGSIEQLAGTTSNIKINPDANIFSALQPVTDFVVKQKIKENDIQNRTESLKLENDYITEANLISEHINQDKTLSINKEAANAYLKERTNALIEKFATQATNKNSETMFRNSALGEVQKQIFSINTDISNNILVQADAIYNEKKEKIVSRAFLKGGIYKETLEQDLENLTIDTFKNRVTYPELQKILKSIPSEIQTYEAIEMVQRTPRKAYYFLKDDKNFPDIDYDKRQKLKEKAAIVIRSQITTEWKNYTDTVAAGKEPPYFDMKLAVEVMGSYVGEKMLQEESLTKDRVTNNAVINNASIATENEVVQGYIDEGYEMFGEAVAAANEKYYRNILSTKQTAMKKDPVDFIIKINPDIEALYEEMKNDDNADSLAATRKIFTEKVIQQQKDMGISNSAIRITKKSEIEEIKKTLTNTDTPYLEKKAFINGLSIIYGKENMSKVLNHLQAENPNLVEYIVAISTNSDSLTEDILSGENIEDLKKIVSTRLDSTKKFNSIEKEVAKGMANWEEVILAQGEGSVVKTKYILSVQAAIYKAALQRIKRGDSVSDAVDSAVSDFTRDYYIPPQAIKTWMIPVDVNGVRTNRWVIEEKAEAILFETESKDSNYLDKFHGADGYMHYAKFAGIENLTEEQAKDRITSTIRNHSKWLLNADSTGIILNAEFANGTYPIVNANGQKIEFFFTDTPNEQGIFSTELKYPVTGEDISLIEDFDPFGYMDVDDLIDENKNIDSNNITVGSVVDSVGNLFISKANAQETKISFSDKKKSEQHQQLLEWWKTKYQTKNNFIDTSLAKRRLKEDWKVPVEKYTPSDYVIRKLKAIGATDEDFKRLDKQNATKAIEITSSNLAGDGGYSKKDYKILLGQIAQIESQYKTIIQIPKKDNPEEENFYASSYWQIEIPTARDLLKNMLPGAAKKPIFGPNFESTFAEYKSDKYRTVVESLYNLSKKELVVLLRTDFTLAAHFAGALIATRFK